MNVRTCGYWIVALGVAVCVLIPAQGMAGALNLTPLVDVTAGYDDNVYYTYAQREADYLATAKPGFTLDYNSEVYTVRSSGYVEFLRYLHNSSINRENYYALLDGAVKLTERLNLKGDFSFINDTTLDTQVEETGIVGLRTDRKRYNAGGELAYAVTSLSNVGMAVNHQSTRYGSDRYEDYDYESAQGFYNLQFNNSRDQFTILPYYGYWKSDVSTVNNYGLSFGLTHVFSETLSLEVFVGPRFTQTDQEYTIPTLVYDPGTGSFRLVDKTIKNSDSTWGGSGNIQLKKNWLQTSGSVGFSHDLTYSSNVGRDAEAIEVDRFFFTGSHSITTRLRVGLSGSFYISESATSIGDQQDTRYLTVSPFIGYDLTRDYALRLDYAYSWTKEEELRTGSNKDRNRVWLTFTGRWPMTW